mmetsp:Transcript_9734/g.36215  ORF Transcript_9734/g.36215 Transcript_9734/m.36215 type:complete len:83 (+) Transcript_9734:790-1038(+)
MGSRRNVWYRSEGRIADCRKVHRFLNQDVSPHTHDAMKDHFELSTCFNILPTSSCTFPLLNSILQFNHSILQLIVLCLGFSQ